MNKYNNKTYQVDNITFHSKKEANRYLELKLLATAGEIRGLELQPKYELQPGYTHNGKKIREIIYIADFDYIDNRTGKTIVEDVKGFKTEIYRIKKKLLLYKYPNITFLET
jgi:hypothetical protein